MLNHKIFFILKGSLREPRNRRSVERGRHDSRAHIGAHARSDRRGGPGGDTQWILNRNARARNTELRWHNHRGRPQELPVSKK